MTNFFCLVNYTLRGTGRRKGRNVYSGNRRSSNSISPQYEQSTGLAHPVRSASTKRVGKWSEPAPPRWADSAQRRPLGCSHRTQQKNHRPRNCLPSNADLLLAPRCRQPAAPASAASAAVAVAGAGAGSWQVPLSDGGMSSRPSHALGQGSLLLPGSARRARRSRTTSRIWASLLASCRKSSNHTVSGTLTGKRITLAITACLLVSRVIPMQ